MNHYLVTIKLPKNPAHDPRNKVTGPCPLSEKVCTDVTGAHHTIMVRMPSIEDVRSEFSDSHITRIEEI